MVFQANYDRPLTEYENPKSSSPVFAFDEDNYGFDTTSVEPRLSVFQSDLEDEPADKDPIFQFE